jgi:hypothetical protein
MLIGQLFLISAVAKVITAWRPQRRSGEHRGNTPDVV